MNGEENIKFCVAVYCGKFSMVVGGSLIFFMVVDFFFKCITLHLSLKGGFRLNLDIGYVDVFLFNYI